jgi:Zn-finger protein
MGKSQLRDETFEGISPIFKCSICGEPLYPTDSCNMETTFHCSSSGARFWDFERGSIEQFKAKEHWEKSRIEIYSENR